MSIVLLFDLQVGKIERRNEQSSISACMRGASLATREARMIFIFAR